MVAEAPTSQQHSKTGTPTAVTDIDQAEEDLSGRSPAHIVEVSEAQTLVASTSDVPISKGTNEGKEGRKESDSSNFVGKINNLMSTDLKNITEGVDFLFVILYAPIEVIVSAIFLYQILGWSAIIGMVVLLASVPIPAKMANLINEIQSQRMKKTDARVETISESMNVIRMIKLFAWENKIKSQISAKREEELRWLRKRQYLGLANIQVNFILPVVMMIATYGSHTLIFGHSLDASTVFSSIGVFQVFRNQLHWLFWQTPRVIQGRVSLNRFNKFLHETELLDAYATKPVAMTTSSSPPASVIGFRNAEFVWTQHASNTMSTARRNFRLTIEKDLLFIQGRINMIIGPTGCGKTSLLMALLGEMHFVPRGPDSWFSLPRGGGIAYAAQEAWIQNETIRNNILFGSEYDEERYNAVISQCALERDLSLFEAGDQTEVGEKGLTLSGGQKARVSLARAIYSKAETIILDDVLSALDVHTARWIVDNCFKGGLISGRTMIIVAHNVAMISEVADFVVAFGSSGRIIAQGSVADTLQSDTKTRDNPEKDDQEKVKSYEDDKEVSTKQANGKLIVAEEVAEGHVEWSAAKFFLLAFGGPFFWILFVVGFLAADVTSLLQTYWLGVWARAYEGNLGRIESVNVPFYLAVYTGIGIGFMVIYSSTFAWHISGAVRASRRIHDQLVASVLGATLRWLDSTPLGRITARFTQDISAVDDSLPTELQNFAYMSFQLMSRFGVVIIFAPIFALPGAFVLMAGMTIGQIYMSAQLSVKREMSNARSPLFSHFGAAIAGITTIRAYRAEELFKEEALNRIDRYTRVARSFYNLNRWVCVRMDTLGGAFAAGLAAYMVYGRPSVDASDTGFSLSSAIAFSGNVLWWVVMFNELEVTGNSLERIQAYIQIEQEPAAVPEKQPPAYWPASGRIVVENLTARYASDGPAVLHGLSFEIKNGERVGIVGRTGSGKSSLTLALLRMIPIEGTVYFEQSGIPTHALNLDALRSNITIIPQQPELLSGTIRQNLDPFDEHDDAVLYSALRSAGGEEMMNLDSGVSAGGANFSLGQRQMIALARAIVKRSKVLILDEATAAIDHKTDTAIQRSLRTDLGDKTLIIVAHRLQTVCDADKIMVLEAGKMVEFDSPRELLHKERSAFKALVDESGDRDALYATILRT
ncbi:ABC transporter transmembrane region [Ceratobasidium sp. AG-Ba]|nr:ABC transporter transmembrane region [Ceratobasidium sp. AG-Ba]